MRTWTRCAASLVVTATVFAGSQGCSNHQDDEPRGNLRPHILVTGGPREGGRASFKSRVYWSGWDDDGVIDHYEYAIDPPPEFTEAELSSPESFPEIKLIEFPSRTIGHPDTLRVSKVSEGVTVGFDYIKTHLTDQSFALSATETDSSFGPLGGFKPDLTASGTHRVYVRAADNELAYSDVASLGFNAWTYTPTSWITNPNTERDFLQTGRKIVITWGGSDPDPPRGNRGKPVGFWYKLVDLRSLTPPLSVISVTDPQGTVFGRSDHLPWTYRSADTLGITLYLDPGQYLFALRAVDAVGGIEPFLRWRRGEDPPGNAFMLRVTEGGGHPFLTVTEPSVGTFTFRGNTQIYEREVAVGTRLRFHWSATAEDYGSQIEAYSWGVDIADLSQSGSGSGWNPWTLSNTTNQDLVFDTPGTHVLYVRTRDSNQSITIGSIVLRIFTMPFDREILYVDDYLNHRTPRDWQHDAFWRDMMQTSGRFREFDLRPENNWYETGGDKDGGFLTPDAPPLSLIGRYRQIIWNVHGGGFCGRTGLLTSSVVTPDLRIYMAAGGKLWVVGSMTLGAMLEGGICEEPIVTPAGSFDFPHEYAPGNFAYDILKLSTRQAQNGKAINWIDDLERLDAWDQDNPIFENLTIDPEKYGVIAWENSGLSHVDAIFEPILTSAVPNFRGQLDSLYAYVAVGQFRKPGDPRFASAYNGRLCATRWHDPDPARKQGRVLWLGFPLYFMMQDQAQRTFNKAIDWFREETRVPPEEGPG